jgi:Spo0E like sporulation regulatory protein.
MFFKQKAILICIEDLRQEMYKAMSAYGIDSLQTLSASQKLDIAINEYYQLKRNVESLEIAVS